MNRIKLWGVLVVVVLAVAIGVVIWVFNEVGPEAKLAAAQSDILKETAKAFLQLIAVGTFGVLVKLAVDEIAKDRDRRRLEREAKADWLQRLRQIHQTIRSVPYLVEEARTPDAYREQIRNLLEARTLLIELGSELRTSRIVSTENVSPEVSKMISYLSALLGEAANTKTEDWNAVLALPCYGDYREATLEFSSEQGGSEVYDDYDKSYEFVKDWMRTQIEESA